MHSDKTEEETNQRRKRILLVDDDKSILRIFTRILERAGYSVDAVETGEEAVEKIKSGRYDISLLDFKLPDTDGMELLMRLGEAAPHMVKIMITGSPSRAIKDEALNCGVYAFLLKPINPQELLQTINESLKK